MSSNFLSLNPSKTEYLVFGQLQQLSKLNNPIIHLPNNVIGYSHLLFLLVILVSSLIKICHLHNISSTSKSCFHNIRDLRRIRNTIDQTTVRTIATSLIHSKID